MPEPEVVRVMREHRAALLRQEGSQMRAMAERWLTVERRLARDIEGVLAEIRRREASGEVFGRDRGPYTRLNRYRALLAQMRTEINSYADWVTVGVRGREAELVRLAVEQSQLAIETVQADAVADGLAVSAGFNRLPTAAVGNMVATLADGAPLQGLLSRAWPDAAVRMTDALVNGVALGWNPRKTARAMAEGMQQGALQRCLVIARTEQLRVYRQATLETYRASGVVRGYRRLAAKQARTCLACLVEDGRFYALDEEFDAHPQCRCTLVPVLEGMPERQWEKGAAWLEKQPASVQKQVMGLARWELWKSGQVGLGEMVERHEHAVWGGSLGVKAVKTLSGGPEALQRVYAAAAQARAKRAQIVANKPPHYKEYQKQRYAEVKAKSDEDWRRLRAEIERAKTAPLFDLKGHLSKHKKGLAEIGVTTVEEFKSLFQQHIRRTDLRVFTYISTQKGTEYRQWAFLGMDNGVVALYNEDQKKFWSLFRANRLEDHLDNGQGWWIEAPQWFARRGASPKVRKW